LNKNGKGDLRHSKNLNNARGIAACLVAILKGNYKLGQWVAVQRYSKDSLTAERKTKLKQLGFIWSRPDWLWEKGFAALKAFKAREGHCHVPASHIEGDLKLGYWVSSQRRQKNIMSKERKRRLNKIGFVWRPKKGPPARYNTAPKSGHRAAH
jgi:hypothetical protein